VTMVATPDALLLKNEVDPAAAGEDADASSVGGLSVRTEMRLNAVDLHEFSLGPTTSPNGIAVAFSQREFKAVLTLVRDLEHLICCHVEAAGRPIIFSSCAKGDGHAPFRVESVLATVVETTPMGDDDDDDLLFDPMQPPPPAQHEAGPHYAQPQGAWYPDAAHSQHGGSFSAVHGQWPPPPQQQHSGLYASDSSAYAAAGAQPPNLNRRSDSASSAIGGAGGDAWGAGGGGATWAGAGAGAASQWHNSAPPGGVQDGSWHTAPTHHHPQSQSSWQQPSGPPQGGSWHASGASWPTTQAAASSHGGANAYAHDGRVEFQSQGRAGSFYVPSTPQPQGSFHFAQPSAEQQQPPLGPTHLRGEAAMGEQLIRHPTPPSRATGDGDGRGGAVGGTAGESDDTEEDEYDEEAVPGTPPDPEWPSKRQCVQGDEGAW
jgi:hypothetical protein